MSWNETAWDSSTINSASVTVADTDRFYKTVLETSWSIPFPVGCRSIHVIPPTPTYSNNENYAIRNSSQLKSLYVFVKSNYANTDHFFPIQPFCVTREPVEIENSESYSESELNNLKYPEETRVIEKSHITSIIPYFGEPLDSHVTSFTIRADFPAPTTSISSLSQSISFNVNGMLNFVELTSDGWIQTDNYPPIYKDSPSVEVAVEMSVSLLPFTETLYSDWVLYYDICKAFRERLILKKINNREVIQNTPIFEIAFFGADLNPGVYTSPFNLERAFIKILAQTQILARSFVNDSVVSGGNLNAWLASNVNYYDDWLKSYVPNNNDLSTNVVYSPPPTYVFATYNSGYLNNAFFEEFIDLSNSQFRGLFVYPINYLVYEYSRSRPNFFDFNRFSENLLPQSIIDNEIELKFNYFDYYPFEFFSTSWSDHFPSEANTPIFCTEYDVYEISYKPTPIIPESFCGVYSGPEVFPLSQIPWECDVLNKNGCSSYLTSTNENTINSVEVKIYKNGIEIYSNEFSLLSNSTSTLSDGGITDLFSFSVVASSKSLRVLRKGSGFYIATIAAEEFKSREFTHENSKTPLFIVEYAIFLERQRDSANTKAANFRILRKSVHYPSEVSSVVKEWTWNFLDKNTLIEQTYTAPIKLPKNGVTQLKYLSKIWEIRNILSKKCKMLKKEYRASFPFGDYLKIYNVSEGILDSKTDADNYPTSSCPPPSPSALYSTIADGTSAFSTTLFRDIEHQYSFDWQFTSTCYDELGDPYICVEEGFGCEWSIDNPISSADLRLYFQSTTGGSYNTLDIPVDFVVHMYAGPAQRYLSYSKRLYGPYDHCFECKDGDNAIILDTFQPITLIGSMTKVNDGEYYERTVSSSDYLGDEASWINSHLDFTNDCAETTGWSDYQENVSEYRKNKTLSNFIFIVEGQYDYA